MMHEEWKSMTEQQGCHAAVDGASSVVAKSAPLCIKIDVEPTNRCAIPCLYFVELVPWSWRLFSLFHIFYFSEPEIAHAKSIPSLATIRRG
jgi:hypothetical protein